MPRIMSSILGGVAVALALAAPAAADEVKANISVRSIMNAVAPVIESRETAYDRVLRDTGPEPPPAVVGQVVDDGTVRYGRTTITVKNPCPPGTAHYEPPPLPGRRR
ncbi:MAG: hypothetical protein HYU41_11665 [Candidatus Rokubacteria bacterium]|nr:hypothetical protein [Candidatus Rokubacteria bacterium]